MRILLTNDDGLRAPGIAALYEALTDFHGVFGGPIRLPSDDAPTEVVPIAPLTVQSATSHGVTFHEPLMVREEFLSGSGPDDRVRGVAVDARPADCVKLAICSLWPERFGEGSRPDLVVSGMNAGANVGINVIYSGTVAAALEAAFLGVPAIAVSLHMGKGKAQFDVAAAYGRRAIEGVLAGGLPRPHACLSVNIPVMQEGLPGASMEEAVGGALPVKVCPMNTHGLRDRYERRVSPAGDVYYWASGHGLDFMVTDEGSDVQWLFRRAVTVTPLMYDLTRHSALEEWKGRLEERG